MLSQSIIMIGADAAYSKTPEEFGKLTQDEIVKWATLIKKAGIKLK